MDATSDALLHYVPLVAVAVLWGVTNPLLNRASQGFERVFSDASSRGGFVSTASRQLYWLITNWKFLLSYGLNQAGSVLYVGSLSRVSLSIAVPVTNALTFLITHLASRALGEKQSRTTWRTAVGMVLILTGLVVCIHSKQDAA